MFKKVLIVLVVLILFASAAAGGIMMISQTMAEPESTENQEAETQQVKDCLVTYFKNLKLGDIDEAYTVVMPGAKDGLKLRESQQESGKSIAEIENEKVKEAAQAYQTFVFASNVRGYAIDNIQVNGDQAVAQVTVKAVNSSAIPEVKEEDVQKYMEQYVEEHQEELNQMLADTSQEETEAYVMEVSGLYTYDEMKKNVQNTPSADVPLTIGLVKKDGQWLISAISSGGMLE